MKSLKEFQEKELQMKGLINLKNTSEKLQVLHIE